MSNRNSGLSASRRLQARAHQLIPGGSHTYAKGDDQYPISAPPFVAHGEGCHVWDLDGNEYIEYGMGNRAVGLGHAYPDVIEAARRELSRGCNFTRPSPIEVACAEQFLTLVPTADMVKFCKDGSDATSAAVRLARAYTGRDMVVICGDHPFFSTDDWFIGTTAMSAGIPATIQNLTKTFRFNDIKSLSDIFAEFPGRIACCILEAERTEPPKAGFLEGVRNLCHANGALFVIDEMITGFRWHRGGAQAHHGIEPDLSCFGKALANGFSVSALAGKREFMRLGGLDHTDKPRVFLLSTTHGAETHALAAAIANMRVYANEPVVEHLQRQGARLRSQIDQVVARHDLQDFVRLIGRDSCLLYETRDRSGQPSQGMRTLLLQETLRRGVIMPSLVVAYTHSDSDIDKTVEALDGALAVYRRALDGRIEDYLAGRASEPVMRAYNRLPTA